MRKHANLERMLSDKTGGVIVPLYDKDRARTVNALFNFASIFFEEDLNIKSKSLPEIVKKIIRGRFYKANSEGGYLRREIGECDPSEVEFNIRQALSMRSYNPLLVNMIKASLTEREFAPISPLGPFSPIEREVLLELVIDRFGLAGEERKSLKQIAEERNWQEGTPKYWIDFVLNKLRKDDEFLENLGDLWDDALNGRLITSEQELRWKKDKELFDIDVVLGNLNKNPRAYGNEAFRDKKRSLLLRLHKYGLTGPQIAEELGIQRQTIYNHLHRVGERGLTDGGGIERALRDYNRINNSRLRTIIERQVFQPWIDSTVRSISQDMEDTPLYQLLSSTGQIRIPNISPSARAIFYEHIGELREVIEEEMKRRLFNDDGLSKRAADLLEKHLSPKAYLVLNCQYGLTAEKKTLQVLGDAFGGCTSQAFYYKEQGLEAVKKNRNLRNGLLKLWRGALDM